MTNKTNSLTAVDESLIRYVERNILPMYANFDTAHRVGHAQMVIAKSLELAETINRSPRYAEPDGTKTTVDADMVYAIASYHDTGLTEGRETHHTASALFVHNDSHLRQWFTPEQIDIIADAVEDHRASSKAEPRTIYGKIVAEADRSIDPMDIIRRTVQYGLSHYPGLDKDGHYKRTVEHLLEKYAEGGYLKLWIPESDNGRKLQELRDIIRDKERLDQAFGLIWDEECEK